MYSTEKGGAVEKDIETIRRKIQEAQDKQSPTAYAAILTAIGVDPASSSFRKRMAAFRRACNLPD